jgi:ribosomal-protein-alanine N-acetyltransferase
MSAPAGVALAEGGILDLGTMISIMAESFDPAYGEAWTGPQCAGLLPMPGVWLTLARDDAEVIGFALGRIVVEEAELMLLAVKRGRQRAGVGQLLLDRFTTIARRKGAARLHLEVREGNGAINLYKRAGFAQVGRRRNYYNGSDGQLYDALTLAKSASS